MKNNKNIVNFEKLSEYCDDKNHEITPENMHTFARTCKCKKENNDKC